jgi:hypothetical protein
MGDLIMIIVLAGRRIDALDAKQPRFPLRNAHSVAGQLFAELDNLKEGGDVLVCSAACGADLLALDAAKKLGIRRRIVLPFDADRFRITSVKDRPGNSDWNWGQMFDSHYEEAQGSNDLIVLSYSGDDEVAYAAANERIVAEAMSLAGEPPQRRNITAVIVWDGASRGESDLTAKLAGRARIANIPVKEINTLKYSIRLNDELI